MSMTRAQREEIYGPLCTDCDCTQENCECEGGFRGPNDKSCKNCGHEEIDCECEQGFCSRKKSAKGAWIICPTCHGEGKHSRHLGSYTQSEFQEAFPEEEDRQLYFSGGYDQHCHTCNGTGKIREDDDEATERLRQDREADRIRETGYNDAGEFVAYPDWHRGPRM